MTERPLTIDEISRGLDPTIDHLRPAPGPGDSRLRVAGQTLHCRRYGAQDGRTPLVYLHEGLGSVELWRSFPEDVVGASNSPGLAYSRRGNGWSDPLEEPRRPDYMHDEALKVLPRVLTEFSDHPPILIGHSDGASIALIHAGSGHPVAGLVLIAPHVFVEPETVKSISTLRDDFPGSEMAEKMSKYHTDPEQTFYGWADVWLSAEFRSWNIEEFLPAVQCPVLLVQGDADEYGTALQLEAIAAGLSRACEAVWVHEAEHSPHLSHPEEVSARVIEFIEELI